jgi:hypothetical protein
MIIIRLVTTNRYISETFFPAHSASLVYYLPHASGESASFPTSVKEVGSSALLILLAKSQQAMLLTYPPLGARTG